MYYVYLHIEKDTGLPFYVGKGKGKRCETKYNRSVYWKNVADKHGWYSDIVAEFTTEAEAFACETEVIKFFGRRNVDNGLLVNLTEGGEGNAGTIFTQERLENMSRGRKGIRPSPEARAKMSAAAKKRPHRAHSEETKERLRQRCKEGSLKKWKDPEYANKVSQSHKGIRYVGRKSPKEHITKNGVRRGHKS